MLRAECPGVSPALIGLRSGLGTVASSRAGSPLAAQPEPEPTELLAKADRQRTVLLVEDNRGDIRLVREALAKCSVSLQLSIAHDGIEALSLLRNCSKKPELILLDLNLPGMDGRTLLHFIKSAPDLLRIPVVIVSGSDAVLDVTSAYAFHANCYLVKPTDFVRFEQAIRQVVEFWTCLVRLPAQG
jgi:CheY-like chemotaxis protein